MSNIILASQSPRRKEILQLAEIPFEVRTENTPEIYPEDLAINDVPAYLAALKAKTVFEKLNDIEKTEKIVIASDTIVTIDNTIIGKPQSEAEAIDILNKLSGKTHYVITGVCIQSAHKTKTITDTSEVVFRNISPKQIAHYVSHYRPYDKAGAYAIQEWIGAIAIEKINGDYYSIMGLPISKVVAALEAFS